MEELMEAMGMADERKKKIKKKAKRKIKILKKYEFQKSMMFAIQAITGHQTHEIMAILVEEADKHLQESQVDLTLSPKENHYQNNSYSYSSEKRLRQYKFYPGTELYIGSYILYTDYDTNGFDARLNYSFKFPVSSLKLDEDEYNEYITDGILCDSSKDIDKPVLKGTLTKEEREIKELQNKQKQKDKAAKKRLAKQRANMKP